MHQKQQLGFTITKSLLGAMLIAAFSGMAMYYIDFPMGTQPIHLVIAAILLDKYFIYSFKAEKPKTILIRQNNDLIWCIK